MSGTMSREKAIAKLADANRILRFAESRYLTLEAKIRLLEQAETLEDAVRDAGFEVRTDAYGLFSIPLKKDDHAC